VNRIAPKISLRQIRNLTVVNCGVKLQNIRLYRYFPDISFHALALSVFPSIQSGCNKSNQINEIKHPSPGVKLPRRRAYHSPPSTVEMKDEWSYVSTPPM
jgi:hypothetical protein